MSNCSVPDCDRAARYKGLCSKHYKRQWRHGDPTVRLINEHRAPCKVEGCHGLSRWEGMCAAHVMRWKRHGRLHLVRAPDGEGRPRTSAGYILLTREGKRVYEHIYLAEKALGKPLPKGAVVHHVNECPWDNTPSNLVVCPDQSYHRLLHQRAKLLAKGLL